MSELLWRLSPSIIESYFYHQGCLRSLILSGIRDNILKEKFGFASNTESKSSVAKAGDLWESDVLEILINRFGRENVHINYDSNCNPSKIFESEFVSLINGLSMEHNKKTQYVYQPQIKITDSFLRNNIQLFSDEKELTKAINGDGFVKVDISHSSFPDLIRVDYDEDSKKFKLSLVDVKLAKKPKIEHKMQIGMYVLLLKELLIRNHMDDLCYVNEDEAYIFNKGLSEETPFKLKNVFNFLKSFLNDAIPGILEYARHDCEDNIKYKLFPYITCQKCEWCSNYESCINDTISSGNELKLLPYISSYAQEYLEKLFAQDGREEMSINSLDAFIADERNKMMLIENSFWKRVNNDYDAYSNALRTSIGSQLNSKRYYCKRSASCEMPKYEDCRIVLTSQRDEATDNEYLWGISFVSNRSDFSLDLSDVDLHVDDVFVDALNDNGMNYVVICKNTSSVGNARRVFMEIWHAILTKINLYNVKKTRNLGRIRKPSTNDFPLSVQHYIMDNYELQNIERTLYELSECDDSFEKAVELLLMLQGKELVSTDEIKTRPVDTKDFPATVLTSVISKLFVLPVFLSYSLIDCYQAFYEEVSEEQRDLLVKLNNECFVSKKSNTIKSDYINKYWNSLDKTFLDDLGTYILHKLTAENILIDNVRKSNHAGIALKPYPFKMPAKSDIKDDKLGKLRFETLYEAKLTCLQLDYYRSTSISNAIDNGKVWSLSLQKMPELEVKTGKYIVDLIINNSDSFFKDKLMACVICKDNADLREAIPFYTCSKSFDENAKAFLNDFALNGLVCADIIGERELVIENGTVSLKIYGNEMGLFNRVGTQYLMFEIYSNYLLEEKSLPSFCKADDESYAHIYNPLDSYKKTDLIFELEKESIIELSYSQKDSFSLSQMNAFKQLCENNITLLLGPPGSGKTNFIARSILTLSRYYMKKGKMLRVLISANSHAAIENVLFKVTEMMAQMRFTPDDMLVVKMQRKESEDPYKTVQVFSNRDLNLNMAICKPLIVGATIWASSSIPSKDPFDLIILDEASQVRMADSIIPFMLGNSSKTRYLIVGDENQLPPIIHGKYEINEDKPYILGSVFRYYYDCNKSLPQERSFVMTLGENFRSNQAIYDYSSIAIEDYKNKYRPFNDAIATQNAKCLLGDNSYIRDKIEELYPKNPLNELYASILNTDYQLVLCSIKGINSSDEKEKEVQSVKYLTRILQYIRKSMEGEKYTAKNFWSVSNKGECGDFGIVSPHHEHIKRIKNCLKCDDEENNILNETENDFFIGTVDKLQGQERQMVIVSYGVTDVEQALTEGEFIYNRNRLNVAITRAKKKCILFLSEALLEYPIEALAYDDQSLIDGVNYVCGLKDYMSTGDIIETEYMKVFRKK